jgi:hypothetical protein
MIKGAITSGAIALVIGVVATVGLSFIMAPPWGLSQAIVCVAIASFMGAAVGYWTGFTSGGPQG